MDKFTSYLNRDGRQLMNWVLVFYALGFLVKMAIIVMHQNSFVVADWLINYTFDGFKRRGLAGTFIILAHKYLGVSLLWSVFTFCCIVFGLVLQKIHQLIKQRYFPTLGIFLFLSPLGFMFEFNNLGIFGRKDAIIFLLFLWLISVSSEAIRHGKLILVFSLAYGLSILHHEVILFYWPWFIYLIYDKSNFNWRNALPFTSILTLVSVAAGASVFLFGKQIHSPGTNAYLLEAQMDPSILDGILTFPTDFNAPNYILDLGWKYPEFLFSIAIGVIPWLIVFWLYATLKEGLHFLRLGAIMLTLSFPLFFVAIDWGRWIHNHYMLLLFWAMWKVSWNLNPNTLSLDSEFIYFYSLHFSAILCENAQL